MKKKKQKTIGSFHKIIVKMRQRGKTYEDIRKHLSNAGLDVTATGIRTYWWRNCQGISIK